MQATATRSLGTLENELDSARRTNARQELLKELWRRQESEENEEQ